jgi:hypothetical protein
MGLSFFSLLLLLLQLGSSASHSYITGITLRVDSEYHKSAYGCDLPALREWIEGESPKVAIDEVNELGQTSLFMVAANVSQALMQSQAVLPLCDFDLTAQAEAISYLLSKGANPDAADFENNTPLRLLLDAGCMICLKEAMEFASVKKSRIFTSGFVFGFLNRMESYELNVLPFLLTRHSSGANITESLLKMNCKPAVAEELLVPKQGNFEYPTIKRIFIGWKTSMLKLLLSSARTSVLIRETYSMDGQTILMKCAHSGFTPCVDLLLQLGSPTQNQNQLTKVDPLTERTPLHFAAATGFVDTARSLLGLTTGAKDGAMSIPPDPMILDRRRRMLTAADSLGRSPVDVAASASMRSMLRSAFGQEAAAAAAAAAVAVAGGGGGGGSGGVDQGGTIETIGDTTLQDLIGSALAEDAAAKHEAKLGAEGIREVEVDADGRVVALLATAQGAVRGHGDAADGVGEGAVWTGLRSKSGWRSAAIEAIRQRGNVSSGVSVCGIDVRRELTTEEFLLRYHEQRPVIIRGALNATDAADGAGTNGGGNWALER